MGKNYLQHLHIPSRTCYINWDNRMPLHCIFQPEKDVFIGIMLGDSTASWKKIICIISIPEADTFIGMKMFPTVHHREFPCVQRNPHYYPGIFINFCTLINILSTQLWFYHTHTDTHTHHTSLTVPILSLNFNLSNLEFGYLNNLKCLNEW